MTGTWHPRAPTRELSQLASWWWFSYKIKKFEGKGNKGNSSFDHLWTSKVFHVFELGRRTKWAHRKKIAFQTAWDVPTFPNVQSQRRISTSVSPPLDEDAPLYGLSEHLSVSHVLGMNDSIWAPKPRVTWLYGLISLCFIHTIFSLKIIVI